MSLKCAKCGTKKNLTEHHISPRKFGVKNICNNKAILCRSCHNEWHKYEMYFTYIGFWNWLKYSIKISKKHLMIYGKPISIKDENIKMSKESNNWGLPRSNIEYVCVIEVG